MRLDNIVTNHKQVNEKDNPCWDGYEMVGMKKKGKKKVPNCVPKESVNEGYRVLPPMDTEKYQERPGLEGPYRLQSGKVVYYDPQEGKYYDPDSDFYMSDDEYFAHAKNESVAEAGIIYPPKKASSKARQPEKKPGLMARMKKKMFGEAEGSLPDRGDIETSQLPPSIQKFLDELMGIYWERDGEANVIPYSAGYGYSYENSAGPGNMGVGLERMGLISDEESFKKEFKFKFKNWDVSIWFMGNKAIFRFNGPMEDSVNEAAEDFVRDMVRVHGWSQAKAEAEARKRFPEEYGIDPNANRNVEVHINGKPWKVVAHKNIGFKIKATLEAKGKKVELFYTDKPVSESITEKKEAPAKPDAEKAKRRKEIEAHQQRRRELGDNYWDDEEKPKKRRMGGRYGYGASDDEMNESYRIKQMKDELNKKLNEGVLDATDDDGWMAKSQLYKAAKYAIALHGMIKDTDELPAWVQSKITSVSEDLSDVKHFIEYAEMSIPEVESDTDYQIAPESIESAGIDFYESIKKKIK